MSFHTAFHAWEKVSTNPIPFVTHSDMLLCRITTMRPVDRRAGIHQDIEHKRNPNSCQLQQTTLRLNNIIASFTPSSKYQRLLGGCKSDAFPAAPAAVSASFWSQRCGHSPYLLRPSISKPAAYHRLLVTLTGSRSSLHSKSDHVRCLQYTSQSSFSPWQLMFKLCRLILNSGTWHSESIPTMSLGLSNSRHGVGMKRSKLMPTSAWTASLLHIHSQKMPYFTVNYLGCISPTMQ